MAGSVIRGRSPAELVVAGVLSIEPARVGVALEGRAVPAGLGRCPLPRIDEEVPPVVRTDRRVGGLHRGGSSDGAEKGGQEAETVISIEPQPGPSDAERTFPAHLTLQEHVSVEPVPSGQSWPGGQGTHLEE
eukprot:SAG11_NODE_1356_length_5123_cov_2.002787_6_plen_132_part_00